MRRGRIYALVTLGSGIALVLLSKTEAPMRTPLWPLLAICGVSGGLFGMLINALSLPFLGVGQREPPRPTPREIVERPESRRPGPGMVELLVLAGVLAILAWWVLA